MPALVMVSITLLCRDTKITMGGIIMITDAAMDGP